MGTDHDDRPRALSGRERCRIVAITLGFLLVLGYLTWLALRYEAPAGILEGIPQLFRAGKIRSALGLCAGLVFYVAVLPAGLILSLLILLQAARGTRTRRTGWFLRETSHEEVQKRHERMLDSMEAEEGLSATDRTLQTYLPPAVG